VLQALLGGLRVLHLSVDLAMVHGCLAQLFLCLVVALAVVTSPRWLSDAQVAMPRPVRMLAPALTALVAAQLILGIVLRHTGDGPALARSPLFYAHAAGAMLIVFTSSVLVRTAERCTAAHLARSARRLASIVLIQVVLGIASWATVVTSDVSRSATLLESWLPSLHVVTGAAVLATSVAISLHALRVYEPAGARVSAQTAGAA
jgi:cytochrome c oxidase assembly protein subunit 15